MSSNFNNAKVINVYYNKGDRKPYDVNGKPIAYIGEEFVGSNESSEIRFFFGQDLDSATPIIITKRPDGETYLDLCQKIGTGVNSYYRVFLNNWYAEVKGKLTIVFKVYNGSVTFNEGNTEILTASGQVIVSDIFNLEVGYAPLATSAVPPFDPSPETSWYFALSQKLDKAQSITVTGALPTLTGDVYDDRYFYVENEGVGRLYYINGSTAIEVVFQVGTLKLTATGNGDVTADTGKLFWNQPNGTVNVGLYNNVNVSIGEDVFYYVKASGAITKGDVIQYAGYQGDHALAKRAVQSEVNANPKLIMGVAKQNITNGDFGYVAHFGKIEGVDTKGVAVNSFVWFDSAGSTAGNWTTTQPTAPNAKILLAVVIKAETSTNANNGILLVRPTIEPKLEELQNVLITSVANGNVLSYDGTKWVNSTRLSTAETNITNLQGRMTTEEGNVDNLQGRMTTAEANIEDIEDGTTIVPKALGDQLGRTINTTYLTQSSASATYIPLSQKGANNGVASLNNLGRIPSSQLPGSFDEIFEVDTFEDFPEEGTDEIIYLTKDTNKIYRWSGTQYVEISPSIALGETSSTAYRGDRGKTAYDHSQIVTGNPHGTTIGDIGAEPANANIQSHINSTSNPHGVTVGQIGAEPANANIQSHISSTSNPHSVTVGQIGAEPANANIQTHVTLTNGSNPHQTTFANIETKPTTISGYGITDALVLGETSTTAYRGDRGKEAYDYSQVGHLPLAGGTITNNLTVGGDLTVSGTTTTVNTTEVNIKDNLILINSNQTGTPSSALKGGLEIERGDLTNFQFVFDESDDRFKVGQVDSLQTVATRTDDGTIANRGITYFNTSTNRLENNANIVVNTDNNVGIGTASPSAKLEIFGATQNIFKIIHNATGGGNWAINPYIVGISNAGLSFTDVKNSTIPMVINDAGNIGIGTTSPSTKLDVKGNTARFDGSGGGELDMNFTTTNTGSIRLKFGGTTTPDKGRIVYSDNSDSFGFFTNSTERMRITSAGNVGIGTTDTTFQNGGGLVVYNADTPRVELRNSTSGATSTDGAGMVLGGNEFYIFNKENAPMFLDTNGSTRMTILGGGNVGIGTTSPVSKLTVNGDIAIPYGGAIKIYNPGNNTLLAVSNLIRVDYDSSSLNDFTEINVPGTTSSHIRFLTGVSSARTEQVRINSSGNVGIGTTSPGAKLSLFGNAGGRALSVNPNSSTEAGIEITVGANSTGQDALYVYSTSNSQFNAFIRSNGNLENRNNSYGGISDIKLKENITNAKPKLNDLNKVRVVNYNFKNEETKQLGVIAQELQEIFPGMVEETEDKDREGKLLGTTTKSVKYSVFVPMLIKAVQELKEQLDELKAKVN
jgi:hypothetical protein